LNRLSAKKKATYCGIFIHMTNSFSGRSLKYFLSDDKYQSLKTLAFAAHIGESRFITPKMVDEMNISLDEFDLRSSDFVFSKYYINFISLLNITVHLFLA
jgi:hypothetical protein